MALHLQDLLHRFPLPCEISAGSRTWTSQTIRSFLPCDSPWDYVNPQVPITLRGLLLHPAPHLAPDPQPPAHQAEAGGFFSFCPDSGNLHWLRSWWPSQGQEYRSRTPGRHLG